MLVARRVVRGDIKSTHKKLVLYGNGPHARVVYGRLHDYPDFAGFIVEDDYVAAKKSIGDFHVIPLSEALDVFPPAEYAICVAIAFRILNTLREEISDKLRELGYEFASVVDSSVRLPHDYSIDENAIVMDQATIDDGAQLGEGVFVGSGAKVGHDCTLEPYSWLSPGVTLAGEIHIGRSSVLGLNCSVKQLSRLGDRTLVMPNAYLSCDTEADEAWGGASAKRLPTNSTRVLEFGLGLRGR